MQENKKVTYKHLKKGQEIRGTEYENCYSGFTAYVKEINPAYVTVEMWKVGGIERKINADSMFLIPMSNEEIREKYNNKAGEIVQSIQTTMSCDEIGYHEMYNAWLSSDPWELAQACVKEKLSVVGHSKDIVPKTAMFSGEKLDVGVCVQDEVGDKFWCHFKSMGIRVLVRRYEKYQTWKAEGKTGDIENILYDVLKEIAYENEKNSELKKGEQNDGRKNME